MKSSYLSCLDSIYFQWCLCHQAACAMPRCKRDDTTENITHECVYVRQCSHCHRMNDIYSKRFGVCNKHVLKNVFRDAAKDNLKRSEAEIFSLQRQLGTQTFCFQIWRGIKCVFTSSSNVLSNIATIVRLWICCTT